MNLKIKNALVSLSDKENINLLLKIFKKYKINIISSGGTYKSIKKLGYDTTTTVEEGIDELFKIFPLVSIQNKYRN